MSATLDRPHRAVLPRLVLATSLLEVQFWFPVWLFFLLDRGFSLTEAVLADGIFRFTVVAAEVPLARVADRVGRRRTMLVLAAGHVGVFLAISAVHGLADLVVVWILWGLVWALASGASGAYLYDLAGSGQIPHRPERALAAMRASAAAATLISIVMAGHLYARDVALPFIVTAVLALAALLVVATLPEVTVTRERVHVRLREVYGSAHLRALTTAAGLVLLFGWSTQVLFQPLSAEQSWSATTTGRIFAAFAFSGMVGHVLSTQWRGQWRTTLLLAWATMVAAVAALAVSPGGWAVAAMALLGLSAAFAGTSLESRLLAATPLQARATALAVVSALAGVGIGLARPALGIVTDHHTTTAAFALWAVCGVALTLPLVVSLRRAGGGPG